MLKVIINLTDVIALLQHTEVDFNGCTSLEAQRDSGFEELVNNLDLAIDKLQALREQVKEELDRAST